MLSISNGRWLEANLDPEAHRIELNIPIPDLPSAEVQKRFTGRDGRVNLQQAFDFYQFVSQQMPEDSQARYRVIDFGGGWGRIMRLFLREVAAQRLILLDCMKDAVECARSLNPPFEVVLNDVSPPLPMEKACADCCYAFSVFSHLSEKACIEWISDLGQRLVPGGKLIITTRGRAHLKFINSLQKPRSVRSFAKELLRRGGSDHINGLITRLPKPDVIERLYDQGAFQFYPTGGGAELTEDFYGETWIPEAWIKERCQSLGFSRYNFFTEFATVDQCVFVLTK